MTNGNGGPWWVRAITTVGVPSAMALGLVYWLTTSMSQALSLHEEHSAERVRELTGVMRQICVNTADTPADRTGCWDRRGDD